MDLAERVAETSPENFDVICAGQILWRGRRGPMGSLDDAASGRSASFVDVTRMLAMARLRVGWAAVLEDDRRGRALLAEMAAIDVRVGGVSLAPVGTDLVVVDGVGGWSHLVSERSGATHVEVPPRWSSQVLLLSGLRAATSSLAAFCKAARRARRDGAIVVLDVVGNMRDWMGHDSRILSMVIREADVIRCSFFDLAVLGTDAAALRRAMNANATLVLDDDDGVTATGTFGEVRMDAPRESGNAEVRADSYTAAICAEYARPRGLGETPAGRWHRVLGREARSLMSNGAPTRRAPRRAWF